MRSKSTILFLLIMISCQAAQLPIGNWRTHFAYNNISTCTLTPDKIFAVSNGSLFSVEKDDELLQTYSKLDGLSDSDIKQIGYSKTRNLLVIAYSNSNIDLVTPEFQIDNITDLYRKTLNNSKAINHMLFKDDYVYLACDFGIVVLDLRQKEITDTYIIGPNASMIAVKKLIEWKNTLYALTEQKIYYAPLNVTNLANYQNWSTLELPSTTIKDIALYNDALYMLNNEGQLYSFSNNSWKTASETGLKQINSNNDVLFLTSEHAIKTIRADKQINTIINYAGMGVYDPESEHYWLISSTDGLMRKSFLYDYYNLFKPQGTASNSAWRMKYSQGRVIVVPGGRWSSQYFTPGTVMIFEEDAWKNITNQQIVDATSLPCTDLVDIAIDPADKTHFYVASYGMGLYEFKNDKPFQLYNNDNSGVETHYPNDAPQQRYYIYHRVDGLRFDKQGNLWFLNPGTYPVKYITPNGSFQKLNYEDTRALSTLQDIIIDQRDPNIKWVLAPRATSSESTCLFVFDDKGTPNNINDDQTKYFAFVTDQDNNKLQPANFRCIVEDKNDTKWVGTSSGLFLMENSARVFDSNYKATRIKIPREDGTNLADYLLESEQINAIVVDGGNRKWIATESSGLYLVSDDGIHTIHHFTTDNSPLISNTVISLCLNDDTGELFIGTANGLISYQTDAIESGPQFKNVHAFPNPVRENYHGPITITGLVDQTRVKITDLSANIVFETISNGALATWDGTRKGGERVATGVYIVWCISKDGTQKTNTKILIIN